jgi:hypothetical protein
MLYEAALRERAMEWNWELPTRSRFRCCHPNGQ